jgi:hypothetical protein
MTTWLTRWAPLAGVLAGLLVGRGGLLRANPPGDSATGGQVIAWYAAHQKADVFSDLAGMLGLVFLVIFAAVVPRYVRHGERWIANGALAGAACAAAGFAALRAFDLVLATDVKDLTPASAQTLNLLQNDFFVPAVVGFAVFGILGGLAVVAGGVMRKWMGWLAFAFGVIVLVPPLSAYVITLIMLWLIVAGIWMVSEGPPARDREQAAYAPSVLI